MSLSPRRSLVGALLVAAFGMAGLPQAGSGAMRPQSKSKPEQKRRRGAPLFRYSTSFNAVPGCGGRECARRRKQIIAGTLLTAAGEQRLKRVRVLEGAEPGLSWDVAGPDRRVVVLKSHAPGKSAAMAALGEGPRS